VVLGYALFLFRTAKENVERDGASVSPKQTIIAAVNTLMWAIEASTVEYGEWKTGIPAARWASPSAGRTAAYTIGLGGYLSGQPGAVQPDSAVQAIKIAMGVVTAPSSSCDCHHGGLPVD
jgi:Na+/melibiose symporter-like transporter